MERLTKRNKDGVASWCGANGVHYSDRQGNIYGNAITKLAAYEDTNLLPEEIPTALEMCKIKLALDNLKEYQRLEARLCDMYDGELSLAQVVEELERHITEPDKPHPVNARILTYEDAEAFDEFKKQQKGWVLVSDRLPDMCGMPCLLTVRNKFGQVRICKAFTGYMERRKLEFHSNEKDVDLDVWEVLAWCLLPEPYKGE